MLITHTSSLTLAGAGFFLAGASVTAFVARRYIYKPQDPRLILPQFAEIQDTLSPPLRVLRTAHVAISIHTFCHNFSPTNTKQEDLLEDLLTTSELIRRNTAATLLAAIFHGSSNPILKHFELDCEDLSESFHSFLRTLSPLAPTLVK